MKAEYDEVEFNVRSIFGAMTNEPLCEVEFAGKTVQVSPDDARSMAMLLLEGAEAADSDACVIIGLTEIGMDRSRVAQLIDLMRHKRAELKGGK